MVALCVGLGLLVEVISGRKFNGALVAGVGFAAMTAIGGVITCFSGLAQFTTAAVVALAIIGYGLSYPWSDRKIVWWPIIGALGVFFIYGSPVILSGSATFLGYVKLDDTSTWLAFTDHVLVHGHSIAGLNPSSYEATIQINIEAGYPLGAFIPLAIGSELTGVDPAWIFQPYLALMAALMSLVLYDLARPVISSDKARAAAIFIAAQPALLVGFTFWGGVKEIDTALLLAVLAASAALLAKPGSVRNAVPASIVGGAALIGVMGAGGAPWVLAMFAVALLWAWRAIGLKALLPRLGVLIAGVVIVGVPTMFAGGHFFSPTQGPLTDGIELGNLIKPLSLAQFAGPWPVGDFRVDPFGHFLGIGASFITTVLVAATVLAWGAGIWFSITRRAWAILLFALGTGGGSLAVWIIGSPWIQGKALATGTVSFFVIAMLGIVALITAGKDDLRFPSMRGEDGSLNSNGNNMLRAMRVAGLVLLIVPVGVVASNAMQYHETYLAPRAQLVELETIGKDFAGDGPTLMTEYQSYGDRHFLRNLDAEGASELRRRQVPLLGGGTADKGAWVDTDQLVLDPAQEGLLTYRTLVLRRSPEQSRPPSPYNLVWRGDYYEVWQRPEDFDPATLIEHKPLGKDFQPSAIAKCPVVAGVAAKAGSGGTVAGAPRAENAVGSFTDAPSDWVPDPAVGSLTPLSSGTATGTITIPDSRPYTVYVLGALRGLVSVTIDGEPVGSARNRINNNLGFIELDTRDFTAGEKKLSMTFEKGGVFRPATGGYPFALGPVVLAPSGDQQLVTKVPASQFRQLCGQRLDWLEALN